MPSKKVPHKAPCPCGSGKRYKQCCLKKGIEWMIDEDGEISRAVPMQTEHAEHIVGQYMRKADIAPELVYAFEQTGLLVSEANEHLIAEEDLAKWRAAVERFRSQHGKSGG